MCIGLAASASPRIRARRGRRLSWQDWDAAFDGLEWINGDSEWRDEPRLPIARALLTYLLRAPQSMATLLDRPDSGHGAVGCARVHAKNCRARRRRRARAAGIQPAHRSGCARRFTCGCLATKPSFRAFSNHVVLDCAVLRRRGRGRAQRVIAAIRNGHVYSVIDALATPGSLSFTATSGSQSARHGRRARDRRRRVAARRPRTRRQARRWCCCATASALHEVTDGPLEMNGGKDPGVYRIEAYTTGAPGGPTVPWIVSNPIYVGLAMQAASAAVDPGAGVAHSRAHRRGISRIGTE